MSELSKLTIKVPIGLLEITATDEAIVGVKPANHGENVEANDLAQKCKTELEEYFAGKRKNFDLPLADEGTDFQKTGLGATPTHSLRPNQNLWRDCKNDGQA